MNEEIRLKLNSYEDIFSDFDPRPYKEKALSDDFLMEIKRASRDKINVELKLILSKNKRKSKEELFIVRRLREHFKKHYAIHKKEMQYTFRKGAKFAFFGMIAMTIATLIQYYNGKTLWSIFLFVILDPAGWFLFWEGLHHMVIDSRAKSHDHEFYEKMSRAKIKFE